jgi:hypothetical protein
VDNFQSDLGRLTAAPPSGRSAQTSPAELRGVGGGEYERHPLGRCGGARHPNRGLSGASVRLLGLHYLLTVNGRSACRRPRFVGCR